jgi:type IV pilus assembly protein PilA
LRSGRPRRPHGFSTLELVLVIGVTLIVAALGFSMVRTYQVRAQIAASLEETAAARLLVVAAFKDRGAPPRDATAAGIDASVRSLVQGRYLDGVEVHNGRLDLRFGSAADNAIAGKVLSLTPYETAGREVAWLCGHETPGVGIEPLGFANGGPQAEHVVTSIEARYLPRECR